MNNKKKSKLLQIVTQNLIMIYRYKKFEKEAPKFWEKFYQNNTNNFFKDR